MSKNDLEKKWAPLLESIGITQSHWANIAQISENQSNQIIEENTQVSDIDSNSFPSIFPTAMRIAARTIGNDLVNVKPMNPGMSQQEIDRINNEVKKENRDGKIDALIEGKKYKEMKPENHPDWKPGPKGHLFYMDFKYGEQKEEKEDESPIKGRRGTRKKN